MFKIKSILETNNQKENAEDPFTKVQIRGKNKFSENFQPRDFKSATVISSAASGLIFGGENKMKSPLSLDNKNTIFSNTFNAPEVKMKSDNLNANPVFPQGIMEKLQTSGNYNSKVENNSSSTSTFNNTHVTHLLNSEGVYPSLITPQITNIPNIVGDDYKNSQAINLEDLLLQEEKLWKVLESLRYSFDINLHCEEYLEFLNMSSIQNLEIYFKKIDLKIEVGLSAISEILSVMCVIISFIKHKLNESTNTHLKNLIYNVHQNFLLVISLILSRLQKDFEINTWVAKLKSVVISKKAEFMDNDEEFLIKENNKMILNMLSKYVQQNFRSKQDMQVYEVLNELVVNIDKHTYGNVKNSLLNLKNMLVHFSMMNQSSLNFQVMPAPYLPPLEKNTYTYTLVLDLDETLVHFTNQPDSGEPNIRPGAEKFLEELSKYYEIVVFTAALQDYADWILDNLDKDKAYIKHRLYRHHASINKNSYVKDISKLGRDLSKTIIIDNVWENFQMQPENGIFIKTWIDDRTDTSLTDLIPLLIQIASKKVKDVRKSLRKVRDALIRFYVNGDTNPYETLRKHLTILADK